VALTNRTVRSVREALVFNLSLASVHTARAVLSELREDFDRISLERR
jgi:hypothetical protein